MWPSFWRRFWRFLSIGGRVRDQDSNWVRKPPIAERERPGREASKLGRAMRCLGRLRWRHFCEFLEPPASLPACFFRLYGQGRELTESILPRIERGMGMGKVLFRSAIAKSHRGTSRIGHEWGVDGKGNREWTRMDANREGKLSLG
jgi:hypothetical protein